MSGSGDGSHPQVVVGAVVDGTVTARVTGVLSFPTADAVRAVLLDQVRRESVAVLALDLAAVNLCDCEGLNVLTQLRHEAQRLGRRVVIEAVGPEGEWLMRRTGFSGGFGYPPDMATTASPGGVEHAVLASGEASDGVASDGRGGDGRDHRSAGEDGSGLSG